jgi:ribosomal protein S12 methylthiotransferase
MSMVRLQAPAAPAEPRPAAGSLGIYLDSLGCAKNLVDSEAMLGLLTARGHRVCDTPHDADVLLVNTCGFLEAAREESVERILELAALKGAGRPRLLAVLGCLVARAPEELREAIPEVDLWLPAGRHGALPDLLEGTLAGLPTRAARAATDRSGSGRAPIGAFAGFGARVLMTPRHTAYLKISEGCSNTCSFCSIPLMRGTQRSRPVHDVVDEAERLAAGGVRELHLVAQDLTHYGFDLPGRPDLLDLVRALSAVGGLEWIRFLYAHPAHLTRRQQEGLFEVPKVVRYLDMPVQHAAPRLLRAMRRPYTAEHVRRQIDGLRRRVPGITLRSTVIVGFPGETERDFATLCRFVQEARFERLGIFTFSREPGTPSYTLPGRPRASTATRRLQELSELQLHLAAEHAAARVGTRVRLLVDAELSSAEAAEHASPLAAGAVALARSEGEALDIDGHVYLEPGAAADGGAGAPGCFVEAEIVAADVYDLRARPVASAPAPARVRSHSRNKS